MAGRPDRDELTNRDNNHAVEQSDMINNEAEHPAGVGIGLGDKHIKHAKDLDLSMVREKSQEEWSLRRPVDEESIDASHNSEESDWILFPWLYIKVQFVL